jgi:CheY-like chemotaxis protein
VLIVDDEERLLQLTSDAVTSRLGCIVDRARDGVEATAAIERADYDLVLSDVRMPRMNGLELLQWVTAHCPDVLPRTVFMTGDGSGTGLNAHIRHAGRPLLRKPVAIETLLTVIERVMDETGVRASR